MQLLCFTDCHIHDEASLQETIGLLQLAVSERKPDLIIGLGDFFDSIAFLEKWGAEFRNQIDRLNGESLFVYGNHDGGGQQGERTGGKLLFEKFLGPAQQAVTIGDGHFVSLADMEDQTEAEAFALAEIKAGSIVLSHAPFRQKMLDQFAAKGARLLLNGHTHLRHTQLSTQGTLEQWNLPPLRFGGFNGEPAGCALIEIDSETPRLRWRVSTLPAMHESARIHSPAPRPSIPLAGDSAFDDDADMWLHQPTLQLGPREWTGGARRLVHRINGEISWDRRYGKAMADTCRLSLAKHDGREYLIVGTTWLRDPETSEYRSLLVLDPQSGDEHFRVSVIGVSEPPTVHESILYVVGQWQEIVAVELSSGQERWRQVSRTETEGLTWGDNRTGGGWSVCPAAVGEHVWTVNCRGDLFGYDRHSGEPRFVYPGVVPLNPEATCTYGNRLSFSSRTFETLASELGKVFVFNGLRVEDVNGQITPPPDQC